MTQKVLALVLFFGTLLPLSVVAEDSLVRFKGGIGVIPVSSGVAEVPPGTTTPGPTSDVVNRNIVRTVQPAGQIWRIADLRADVQVDGRIKVHGRGLLLGGGNNIGMNAGASVFATLICGIAAPFSLHSSDDVVGVPLEPNGDFEIHDTLDSIPPDPCDNPVLLIRNVANKSWFAAGILKR